MEGPGGEGPGLPMGDGAPGPTEVAARVGWEAGSDRTAARIAVDAMGGDHGPAEVVPGALTYARRHPADTVLLVGRPEAVEAHAGGPLPANVRVVAAREVVEMDESPALALRRKRDASILVAMDLIRRGDADAVVTAGHTGAGMAAAVLKLGTLPGVDRPALAVRMVGVQRPFVLLDIGANPDSTGENLYQYARMGAIFAERVVGIPRPRVALLSIGEERGKGDSRIQRATELLDRSNLRFIGNVEGKDLVAEMADVVVCDAVVGNVTIKFFEGLSGAIFDLLRAEFRRWPRGPLAYWLLRPGLERIRTLFDYEKVGGSILLGVRGSVIITHGRARQRMIGYALEVAAQMARVRLPERIQEALAEDGRAMTGPPAAGGVMDGPAADGTAAGR
jgi:glycerol-3-phosphate acyltransferase PlsX